MKEMCTVHPAPTLECELSAGSPPAPPQGFLSGTFQNYCIWHRQVLCKHPLDRWMTEWANLRKNRKAQ